MKLKAILATLAAGAFLLVSCQQPFEPTTQDTIKVSETKVTIPSAGGEVTITLDAVDSWHLDEATLDSTVMVITPGQNGEKPDTTYVPWLTVTPMSGEAGETPVTISAEIAALDRENTIEFICGGAFQQVTVKQAGDPSLKPQFPAFEGGEYWIMVNTGTDDAPAWQVAKPVGSAYGYLYCQEAVVGADGSLSSTASNVFTLTAVEGGFTLQDAAGQYYYMTGTFDSFNVTTDASQSGNVWTVEQTGDQAFTVINAGNGKKMQYDPEYSSFGAYSNERGILPYLVKAEAPAPELLAIAQTEWELQKEAGVLDIPATVNAANVSVSNTASWLQYVGVKVIDGVSNLEFNYSENTEAARAATVTVTASDGTIEASVELSISQLGGIVDATAAEINAAEDGPAEYRLTGYISEDTGSEYGNIYIKDYTGEVYVYGVLDENGESKHWPDMGINAGDIITVIGPKTSYNGNPQLKDVTVEDHKAVTDATLSEFIAAEVADDVWYRLTGTVDNIYNTEYGNFHLLDDAGNDVVVYGLVAGWGGPSKEFTSLGIQEGDVVTIVGVRDEFNGTIQVGDAFFVSKESGSGDEPGEPAGNVEVLDMTEIFADATENVNLTDGETYTWGGLSVTFTKVNSSNTNYNTGDPGLRFYQGDVLTFDAGDKVITKMEFSAYGGKEGPISADTGSVDESGLVWTGESSVVAITAEKQVRFNKLTVTYQE